MNKPVYRRSEQLREFYKILATDAVICIQLQENQITVTISRDSIAVSLAFEEDSTQESNEEEFDCAFHKAYGQMLIMHPVEAEQENK